VLRISFSVKGRNASALEKLDKLVISIPRTGNLPNGTALHDIKATIEKGRLSEDTEKTSTDFRMEGHVLVRPGTDFKLTGVPHKLLATADGFEQISPQDLTDDSLTAAYYSPNKILSVVVELSPGPANNLGVGGVAGQTTAKNASAFPDLSLLRGGLNYALWAFGLLGICLLCLWVFLVLVTKLLGLQGLELGIVKLVPWIAKWLVRPFRYQVIYGVEYRRRGQTDLSAEQPSLEIVLRNMSESLDRLLQPGNAVNRAPLLQDLNEHLTKLAGSNLAATGAEQYLNSFKANLALLIERAGKDASLDPSITYAIDSAIIAAVKELKDHLRDNPLISPTTGGASTPNSNDTQLIRRNLGSRQMARISYDQLLKDQIPTCKPTYLEADAKSSILGKLADNNVYLLQAASSQAPFVLFIDEASSGKLGWAFPNPARNFNRSTLQDVFPTLSEQQFNDAKDQIEPVEVCKVGEGRWKI
jgi:hypothetical protein